MWNKPSFHVAVCIAGLALAGNAAAQGSPQNTFTFQDNFYFYDTCTNETIYITGTTTQTFASIINDNKAHFTSHTIARDTGTGLTSGASYNVNSEHLYQDTVNIDPFSGGYEVNSAFNEQLSGTGAVANEYIKVDYHVTADANRNIVVNRTDVNFSCHG
jgi:hypothetical protein